MANILDPWDQLFDEGGPRNKFGTLSMLVIKAVSAKGSEGFETPFKNRDGSAYRVKGWKVWQGESLPEGQKTQTQIIINLRSTNKDGQEYDATRHGVVFDKGIRITLDSIGKDTTPKLRTGTLEVQVEEVPYEKYDKKDGTQGDRTAFKLVKVFPDKATRIAADKAYWAGRGNGGGASIPANVVDNALNLRAALNDDVAFLAALKNPQSGFSGFDADALYAATTSRQPS